jgi:ATP-dependent DNA helicase PIF1
MSRKPGPTSPLPEIRRERRNLWGQGKNATKRKPRAIRKRVSTSTNTNAWNEQQVFPPPKPDLSAFIEDEEVEEVSVEDEEPVLESGMTAKQEHILREVKEGGNVFFTGSAGTGKSFLTRKIIDQFQAESMGAGVYVTASTGAAAVNIGGCTLHSFAGIGLGKPPVAALFKKIQTDPRLKGAKMRWTRARTLIIDEVSMLDAELFDKLEELARLLRGNDDPFGGIQIILCGDFFQLPPVRKRDDPGAKEFLFKAKCWKRVIQKTYILERIFRQDQDKRFAKILNEIRLGCVTTRGESLLERCSVPFHSRPGVSTDSEIAPTMLYALRRDVDHENAMQLATLSEEEKTFYAKEGGDRTLLKQLQNNCTAPNVLNLKVGAQVVLLKNLCFEMGLVNGSRGVVIGFTQSETRRTADPNDRFAQGLLETVLSPTVRFTNGVVRTLVQETWEIKMDARKRAWRIQFPLALAWALTIHRAQGMTLSKVQMKLSEVWETGHAYVALSRATSEDGLYLIDYDVHKIRSSRAVLEYYREVLLHQPSL